MWKFQRPRLLSVVELHILSRGVIGFLPMKIVQQEICWMKGTGSLRHLIRADCPPRWPLFIINTGSMMVVDERSAE